MELKRADNIRIERTVLQVYQLNLSTMLAFAFSDGSIEFRARSLEYLAIDEGMNKASGLVQVGFMFRETEPCECLLQSTSLEHPPYDTK